MTSKKVASRTAQEKERPSIENRGLGSIPNPRDTRDISLAAVQAPVALPSKYKTDISKLRRRDQKSTGSCVGQAGAGLIDFFNLCETQSLADASARAIYALCKARDGYSGDGTYPRVLAKVLTEIGAPTTKVVEDDPTIPDPEYSKIEETGELISDAYPFRVDTNYAWVPTDAESLKQAVYQNKVILASIEVGKDYSDGRMTPRNARGRHYILVFGFEDKPNGDTRFDFLNSWGDDWGKDGAGYFLFSEMGGRIHDVLAFLDIPNAILEQAKTAYKFTLTLRRGSTGTEVMELQKRLATEIAADGKPCFRDGEFDLVFGRLTEAAVQRYQIVKNIVKSGTPETTGFGQVGAMTRNALNGSAPARPTLYPVVQEKRDQLVAIMAAIGKPIVVTDEYRSSAEQDGKFAEGRTKMSGVGCVHGGVTRKPGTCAEHPLGATVTNARGGESLHNYRCAFDVAYKKGSGVTWEGDFFLIGTIGKILGLEWGGDWASPVDQPHFQFTAGYTLADFQNGRVDESKFGVLPAKSLDDNQNTFMTMWHRTKSFLISAASMVVAAVATVAVANPSAVAAVLGDVQAWLDSLGLWASLSGFLGLVLAEIVKAYLNRRKVAKANREGVSSVGESHLELY